MKRPGCGVHPGDLTPSKEAPPKKSTGNVDCAVARPSRRGWRGPAESSRAGLNPETDEEESTVRFMMIIKASAESEAGVMPSAELLAAMGNYNEELAKAGALLAGEGLHPSVRGARVRFSGAERTVVAGPFAPAHELIAGFWLIEAGSLDEVIAWAKRCPNPMAGESEIEIRQLFEAEDLGEALTPELREQEERLRARSAPQR